MSSLQGLSTVNIDKTNSSHHTPPTADHVDMHQHQNSSSFKVDHRALVKLNHLKLEEVYEICTQTASRPPLSVSSSPKQLGPFDPLPIGIGVLGPMGPRSRSDDGLLGEGLFAKVFRVKHRRVCSEIPS